MDCPPIISRENWGSVVMKTENMTRLVLPVPYFVLTQTGTRSCVQIEVCKDLVRSFQREQIFTKNLTDISYNFLIGGKGSVFEGRGWDLEGKFYEQHNNNSYGIAFIGNFHFSQTNEPSSVAINSSVWLTNCVLERKYLDKDRLEILPHDTLNPKVLQIFRNHSKAPVEHPRITPTPSAIPQDDVVIPLVLAVGGTLLLFFLLLALFCWKRRHQKKKALFQIWNRLPRNVLPRYIISRDRLLIQNGENDCLGSGQFGVVMRGRLKSRPDSTPATINVVVAVKMLRGRITGGTVESNQLNSFFNEVDILIKIGRHANIVNLIGVVLEGEPKIVMEYCSLGSLEKFLQDSRNISRLTGQSVLGSLNSLSDDPYVAAFQYSYQPGTYKLSSINDLIRFSSQISRGMEFVSSQNIIHRDLAARNILLDGTGQAKIADFGMAREEAVYVLERENVALPMRWLALESILPQNGVYNMKTDVWSFGITLWEIFSLCRLLPYKAEFRAGLNRDLLVAFLLSKQRLTRPLYCPQAVFDVMKQCWAADPEDRPTFTQLTVELSDMPHFAMQQPYVDLEEENDVFNEELDRNTEEFSHL